MSLSNAILRGVTGAFVLNSGLSKRGMPTEAAQGLQGFAATGVPAVNNLDPDSFGKFLGSFDIVYPAFASRDNRDPGLLHDLPGFYFISHFLDCTVQWSDEGKTFFRNPFRKFPILR